MNDLFFNFVLLALLLNMMVGLIFLFRKKLLPIRLMTIQLMGTTGVGILLLLGSRIEGVSGIALLLSLLATVMIEVYVSIERKRKKEKSDQA